MISITIKIIMIMIFAVIKQPYTLLMLSSNQWPVLWIGFYNPHRAMTHCAKHSMQTPSCSSVRIKRPLQLWGYFMCLFISLTFFFFSPIYPLCNISTCLLDFSVILSVSLLFIANGLFPLFSLLKQNFYYVLCHFSG